MSDDLDYDDVFTLSGYEASLTFLLNNCVEELKAGVDPKVVLVRFHSKANNLRRMNEADRRMAPTSRRNREEKKSKKKVKTKHTDSGAT